RQVRQLQAAVCGAACDHDAAGADYIPVGEQKLETLGVTAELLGERLDLLGDRHLGAELLGLRVGACHQREATNAGWKAEIILNAWRGAGLAAEGARIQYDHFKAFGCRIHRGAEPGGPRSDDRDVVKSVAVDRARQAEAARELMFGGVAQEIA